MKVISFFFLDFLNTWLRNRITIQNAKEFEINARMELEHAVPWEVVQLSFFVHGHASHPVYRGIREILGKEITLQQITLCKSPEVKFSILSPNSNSNLSSFMFCLVMLWSRTHSRLMWYGSIYIHRNIFDAPYLFFSDSFFLPFWYWLVDRIDSLIDVLYMVYDMLCAGMLRIPMALERFLGQPGISLNNLCSKRIIKNAFDWSID